MAWGGWVASFLAGWSCCGLLRDKCLSVVVVVVVVVIVIVIVVVCSSIVVAVVVVW